MSTEENHVTLQNNRSGFLRDRLSMLRGKSVENILETPLFDETSLRSNSRFNWNWEDTMVAGMTIGDLVYDAIHIDPMVIEAADFVRTEDLSNLFRFSLFADGLAGLPKETLGGHISQIQGYVAERFVGQYLQGLGMEVEFPVSATEPGFDLLVNGDPFQVKCLSNAGGVLEHFNKYPDVPVFVNEEILPTLEGYEGIELGENLFSVPGFTHEEIIDMTKESVNAGHEIFDFEIPIISLTVVTARNLLFFYRYGSFATKDLALNIATELTTITVGSFVGSKALALSMMSLFGPAGAVVGGAAGAIAGSFFGRRVISEEIRDRRFAQAERRRLETRLEDLSTAAVGKSNSVINVLDSKQERIKKEKKGESSTSGAIREYAVWRMEQERKFKGKIRNAIEKDEWRSNGFSSRKSILESTSSLMEMVSGVGLHYHSLGEEWRKTMDALKAYNKKLKQAK